MNNQSETEKLPVQRRFHIMAKPGGSTCNIDCQYCYYLDKADLPNGPGAGRMSDEVLESYIRQYIEGVTKNGKPTFDLVMNGIKLLKKHRVPFNTLTCVNRLNAKRPLDVYRFLRREVQSTYIQFIPIVEYKGFETTAPQYWDPEKLPIDGSPESRPDHPDSVVTDWSVDPDDYGYFLSKVFDEWLNRDVGKVLVNHIETLVAQHLGLPSQICIYSGFCGKGLAVENEGSVYSCDHYVYPEYKLGNVKDNSLAEMVFSPVQTKFGFDKSETLPGYCRKCEYLTDCWGECPKNRILRTVDGEPGLNYLCSGLKKYFKHALPEINQSTNQPINQSTNQPINQPINQSTNQLIKFLNEP
ncbi:MAG: SPASM domain-containing protein [Ignavibacteria bacterium]|nr:SPASM domain-containing protein [Ignavibacteria bacterium]